MDLKAIEERIEGVPFDIVGRLVATATTKLVDAGDETKVCCSIECLLAGKFGGIGQPILRSKA